MAYISIYISTAKIISCEYLRLVNVGPISYAVILYWINYCKYGAISQIYYWQCMHRKPEYMCKKKIKNNSCTNNGFALI